MALKSKEEEKTTETLNQQVADGLEKKTILDQYSDHKEVKDPVLRELAKDRKKLSDQIRGNGAELKAITEKLQKQAAKVMSENTKLMGVKDYINGKIIERHKALLSNKETQV